MRITNRQFSQRHVAGFTLVELLLILFILGSLALLTTAIVDGVDEQARYDDTKQRLTLIKRAIVGDPTRTVNGEPEISGFVTDMGRLPECLRELVYGNCLTDSTDPNFYVSALPAWSYDPPSGIWAGWRGPYLETGTSQVFRDGWGNKDADEDKDARNFGWKLSEELIISSWGKDNAVDGNGYDADQKIQIDANDYMMNLTNWNKFEVEFRNVGAKEILLDSSLKLRAALQFSDQDISPFISSDITRSANYLFPAQNGEIVIDGGIMNLSLEGSLGSDDELEVVAGTEITFLVGGELYKIKINDRCVPNCKISVPGHGLTPPTTVDEVTFAASTTINIPPAYVAPLRAEVKGLLRAKIKASGASFSGGTLSLPLGASVSADPTSTWDHPNLLAVGTSNSVTVTVSEPFTLTGTRVVTNNTGDVFYVPVGTTIEAGNKLVLPFSLPIGVHSISIVCDDDSSYQGVDEVGDPSCSNTPSNEPYFLKLAPRQVPPLKPNPLIWNIE